MLEKKSHRNILGLTPPFTSPSHKPGSKFPSPCHSQKWLKSPVYTEMCSQALLSKQNIYKQLIGPPRRGGSPYKCAWRCLFPPIRAFPQFKIIIQHCLWKRSESENESSYSSTTFQMLLKLKHAFIVISTSVNFIWILSLASSSLSPVPNPPRTLCWWWPTVLITNIQ